MTPYHVSERATFYCGDNRTVMAEMEDNSVDSIVCDPPYEISFMQKRWDGTGIAYDVAMWQEAMRVLKPGGHLLAFSGARTYHRMACAIEDAGFEIRDQIMWVYGSGFPKSLDVSKGIDKYLGAERDKIRHRPRPMTSGTMAGSTDSRPWIEKSREQGFHEVAGGIPVTDEAKQWDGWGTALKPAHEPIVVARKPLIGTVVANVLKHGTGALNIGACRIEGEPVPINKLENWSGFGQEKRPEYEQEMNLSGRWPANLCHDGSEEVLALFPNTNTSSVSSYPEEYTSNNKNNVYGEGMGGGFHPGFGDEGSAARFFMSCKYTEIEEIFSRAKAIIEVWNLDFALTVEVPSFHHEQHVDSALNRAVIAASLAVNQSKNTKIVSTHVTPSELRKISESAIVATLCLRKKFLLDLLHEEPIQNGCRVKVAETNEQTGITMITISHWKSDGSAESVIFDIMPLNSEHGEKVFPKRFSYCAKASGDDRHEGIELNDHPTVKPTSLMRYLCRLVTPPGGTVLDPFMGSGSTFKAAYQEGFNFVGIEISEPYCAIAINRISQNVFNF